jgi:hypothetical protein
MEMTMNTALTIPAGDDFTVIATNPAAMQDAQTSLLVWADHKISEVVKELVDARNQRDIAKERKWNPAGWAREVVKHEKRIDFYKKIKAALEAGYYIVPPFPIDVFAIRTKRNSPLPLVSSSSDNHDQPAQLLAVGEGQYVDPKPVRERDEHQEPDGKGGQRKVVEYYATDYNPVDFPFKLARAEIRDATDKALNLKIFDRLGVLPAQRSPDPIVCGEILVPNQPSYAYSRFGQPKSVMFFVAWWLDTKTL